MIKQLKCLFLTVFFIGSVFTITTVSQFSHDRGVSLASSAGAGAPAVLAKTDGVELFTSRNASALPKEPLERVWQMTGPFGGDVTALAIDPRSADRIWLGTSDGQIFRSTDGGSIWRRIRPGVKAPGFAITVILFDSEKPGVIYAGVKPLLDLNDETNGGGVFISENEGQNWKPLEGMRGRSVRNITQSAQDPNTLAVAARDGVYYTTDRGKSWERITPINDPELKGFHSVAIDPRDAKIIYVGTHHLPWKTTDAGKTWKLAASKKSGMIDDSDIFAIHIDASNPDTVLMSACSGIYRSRDASETWTKIQGIPYTSRRTHVIYQHPTKPEMIFAGTTEGLWLSTDNGKPDSWRRMTSLRMVINSIAIHPARPDRVFLGTDDNGVLISVDGGEGYDASNAGFINRQVRAVIADKAERGRVYAGVIFDRVNGGLFISEDGGVTWNQSMSGMGVRDVYSLYQPDYAPATIYAGTNHGLFRSDDHGRNWTQVKKEGNAEQNGPQAGAPADSETATSESNSVKADIQPIMEPKSASLKSKAPVKAGAKPQDKKAPAAPAPRPKKPRQRPIKPATEEGDILVDLQNQIFAILPLTPINANPEARSSGGDSQDQTALAALATQTAQALQDAPPTSSPSSTHSSNSSNSSHSTWMIASTWNGLFITEDEKKGWKEIKFPKVSDRPDGKDETARIKLNTIVTSPSAPGAIFIGTDEGLFVSRDNGQSFKQMTVSKDARHIRSVVIDPRDPQTIYVGAVTGFFRSFDGGRTWENRGGGMPLVTDVGAIVISAANPNEIYLSDESRGVLFYSKDCGTNWVKVDISQLPSLKLWALAPDPFDANRIYFGSFSGGVYVMSRR